MQTFTYVAIDSEGRDVRGSRFAVNTAAVEQFLKEKGFKNTKVFKSVTDAGKKRVGSKELAVFCRMMSMVFISHLSITDGLKLISEQTENKELCVALVEIHQFMDKGYTFGQSIGMYPHIFGDYLLNMITVGEISGSLDNIFSQVSSHFEKEDRVKRKLKSAVSYPIALAVFMTGIIILLIVRILPMFEATLASMGGVMPISASFIFVVANFISEHSIVFIGAILAIAVTLVLWTRTEKGRFLLDKWKIDAPMFRYVNRRIITSRYARGLSILLRGGVQLINAMQEIINLVNNRHLEKLFQNAVVRVKNGDDLEDIFSEMKIFPPLFVRLVTIGHSAGRLDEMLEKSAGIFDEEVDHAIDSISQTVEPVLIIILSIVVGIILLSVMLPMIGIMNAIG